jgi:hypothetical protein
MAVLCLLLTCFITISCKKFVANVQLNDSIAADTVFTSDASATSAVLGIYKQIMTSNNLPLNGGMSLYPGLSADELVGTAPNTTTDPFTANALPSTNSAVKIFWSRCYAYIYEANACLRGLENSRGLSPSTKAQLTGEVKFLRALCYFYLANLFGDTPLQTTTDYTINAIMPRTPVAGVYELILADLNEASALLPAVYTGTEKLRPNKWTALALLSRVQLYRGAWAEAENAASAIISSNAYTLVANLNNVFLSGSTETIWQMLPIASSFSTGEGNTFNPSSATVRPAYALTASLYNSFSGVDGRKSAWMKTNTVSAIVYPYPNKYKVRTAIAPTEYNIVFRLAELYLIRAEARAQQDKLVESGSDLNKTRNRAGLPVTTAVTKAELLLAIEKERQLEFFAEWGHRWMDLKRTARITPVLMAMKPLWRPEAALYPVPFSEIELNPALIQNPGY